MRDKYERDPKNSIRIILTIQNGTIISSSHLWVSKEMLGDAYRERGIFGFRQEMHKAMKAQNDWTADSIQEMLGYVGGPVGGEKKPWWKRMFGV